MTRRCKTFVAWCTYGVAALIYAPAFAETLLPDGHVVRRVPITTDWHVRLPVADAVVFRGMQGGDGASGSGTAMAYPGGHAGVFLVSVLTHAVFASSSESTARNAAQQAADKVLDPYRPTFEKLSIARVFQEGLGKTQVGGVEKKFWGRLMKSLGMLGSLNLRQFSR